MLSRSARVLLLALATALVAPTPPAFAAPNAETIAQLEQLPANNPYRAALLRLESLPETDRAALKAWTDYYPDPDEPSPAPVLSAEQAITAAGGTVEVLPLPWGDRRPPAKGNQHTNR